jgi:uncharacterized protein
MKINSLLLALILLLCLVLFITINTKVGVVSEREYNDTPADDSQNDQKEGELNDAQEESAPEKEPAKQKEESAPKLPKVAIVIDDLGNNLETDKQIRNIGAPLTLAVLPFRAHTRASASFFVAQENYEIILHMPLEPIGQKDAEERMLFVHMTQEEIDSEIELALKDVGVSLGGVNNHKGSQFTSNAVKMTQFLESLKERGLYFFDSYTINTSTGYTKAKELGIPTARRDVFLDNLYEPEYIRSQLEELIRRAEENGSAIAIAHSHPTTIRTLAESLPLFKGRVQFVVLSELLE